MPELRDLKQQQSNTFLWKYLSNLDSKQLDLLSEKWKASSQAIPGLLYFTMKHLLQLRLLEFFKCCFEIEVRLSAALLNFEKKTRLDIFQVAYFAQNQWFVCVPFGELTESVPLPLFSNLLEKVCISAHSNISSFVIKSFIIKLSHFPGQILQLTMAAFTVISSTYSDELAPFFLRVSEEVDLVDVCPCQFLWHYYSCVINLCDFWL